jgi:hypothetical protein
MSLSPQIYLRVSNDSLKKQRLSPYTGLTRGGGGVAQSTQRLSTGWTVRGSNFGRVKRLSPLLTRPDRHWDPQSLLYSRYRRPFPGIKRPGRGGDHPSTSSTDVQNGYFYTCTPPLYLHGMLQGETYLIHDSLVGRFDKRGGTLLLCGTNCIFEFRLS